MSNILGKKERGNPDEEADIWSKCKSIFDSIFNIELKSPDNLSLEEILKTIRRAQIPMTIREKLKTIPYFSKMDDDQLKSWYPTNWMVQIIPKKKLKRLLYRNIIKNLYNKI